MATNSFALSIANRMNMREQLMWPQEQTKLTAFFQQLMEVDEGLEQASADTHRSKQLLSAYGFPENTQQSKPFAYADGVAIIPVHGMLVNRFSYGWSWLTGYNFIRSQAQAAAADPDVHTILYDVNSGGGEAAGCFELCDDLFALRSEKATVAVVDSFCCSAAYAVASCASKIVVTPSGYAGSIGVVVMWVGYKNMLQKAGIEVQFITAGDHKVDGNPYEDLTAEMKQSIQANVDLSMDAFAALVARNRGMSEQAVRDTQARVYRASEAETVGLIDIVAAPSKALTAYQETVMNADDKEDADPNGSGSNDDDDDQSGQENAMTPEEKAAADAAAAAQLSAAAAAASTTQAAPVNEQAVRTAERERMSGILNSEEAKSRPALANHLALNTEMSVEDAKKMLAVAGVEAGAKAAAEVTSKETASAFTEAMNSGKHPNVGAGESASAGTGGGQEMSHADRILASQAKATGKKIEAKA
jgi:signal peptide peptidase SppA